MTCQEMRDVLMPSLAKCIHFSGLCQDACKWNPLDGHIPRGYLGATSDLKMVRLILITAEPGNPAKGESYVGDAEEMLQQYLDNSYRYLAEERVPGRAARFHDGRLTKMLRFFFGR